MQNDLDTESRQVRKAEKLVQNATTTMMEVDKSAAKKIFEVGSELFGADEFSGSNQPNADGLRGVTATTKKGGFKNQSALKSLISAEDVLEQDGNVDQAAKIGEVAKFLFSTEDYSKVRKEHLALPDKTRND